MRNVKIAFLALTAVITLTTLFVRIPLPSRGYFNFGDVAVIFSGLLMGWLGGRRGYIWGAAAGGIGSGLADVIGGYGLFAPITLIAKGAEGALAALAQGRSGSIHWLCLILGGVAMVSVYFIAETLMPNIGLQGAVAELLPNLIQAGGGIIGGRMTYAAFARVLGDTHPANA